MILFADLLLHSSIECMREIKGSLGLVSVEIVTVHVKQFCIHSHIFSHKSNLLSNFSFC